ncbi:periplasmic heavy metal sensor [Terasakiella sp.]|uniref:periplasmic heavy metal sensor n=1 Tax=Terasakiella sp. TaxID=2034861 RepID=UPI003AA91F5E
MLRNHWRNLLAWGSLFLNVILIGYIILSPTQFHRPPPGPPSPEHMFKRIGEDLHGQDKIIFEQLLTKHAPNMRVGAKDMDQTMSQLAEVIKRDTLDLESIKKIHNTMRQSREKTDTAIEAFVYEMLPALSVDGRKSLRLLPPKRP